MWKLKTKMIRQAARRCTYLPHSIYRVFSCLFLGLRRLRIPFLWSREHFSRCFQRSSHIHSSPHKGNGADLHASTLEPIEGRKEAGECVWERQKVREMESAQLQLPVGTRRPPCCKPSTTRTLNHICFHCCLQLSPLINYIYGIIIMNSWITYWRFSLSAPPLVS